MRAVLAGLRAVLPRGGLAVLVLLAAALAAGDATAPRDRAAGEVAAFEVSLVSGRENGLADARAEALLALARAVIDADAGDEALAWVAGTVHWEHGPLVERRDGLAPRPSPLPNPPMDDLMVGRGEARSRWLAPWGLEAEPVYIAALDVPIGVEDLELVARLGFNALGPAAGEDARAEGARLNLAVLSSRQSSALGVVVPGDLAPGVDLLAPPPGFLLRAPDGGALLAEPWVLWRASLLALQGREAPLEGARLGP